ncbi:MAG: replicative DNA helicase [Solirubrobacteraceae bacterium]
MAIAEPPLAPPHDLEAEQSVLGAIFLSDVTLYGLVIQDGLKPEDFYREQHRIVYQAMMELYNASEPVDIVTVKNRLRETGRLEEVGGEAGVESLAGMVPAAGNLRHYARIVRDHALLRRLLTTTMEIQASVLGHEAAPRDLVESAEKAMLEVAHDERQKEFRSIHDVLDTELDKLHRLSRDKTALTGTRSGYTKLDELTGGFQNGNLIVIAARPSMGKCQRGSALVYDPRTGARRRIDDVVAALDRGEEAMVAALGPDLKLRGRAVRAGVRSGRQPVFRLTTSLGRKVEATANHPLLTIDGWRELSSLRAGDRIAVPRSLPLTGHPRHMRDAEIVLLAGLIADGNLTQHTPRFCFGRSSAVVAEVRRAAEALGARLSTPQEGWGTGHLSAGHGVPNPVTELCRRHGIWGKRARDKFVPDAIFGLSNDQLARFLSILFACDGYVHVSGRLRHIGYTTISERLARDVQHLLLRFGVVGQIRTLRRKVYEGTDTVAREVRITAQHSVWRFSKAIPICGKDDRLAELQRSLATSSPKAIRDSVPSEAWARVLPAKGDRPWRDVSRAAARWHGGTRTLERETLAELVTVLESEDLLQIATSDLWWDEVASIEPIGDHETFDLEVAGDHNFVADDVVVHNSALVTNIAENAAIQDGVGVALFSLEMSEAELAQRFIASQASIKGEELRKGRVDEKRWPKILQACQRLSEAPLYVDDSSDTGLLEVRAKARRLASQVDLGLIIVDYLQLMHADQRIENRVEQVSQMSRGLKLLARELDVPVIALSQLNRSVESRTDKRPMMSDLRESGAIEQDADVFMFIYRDEYYNKDSKEPGVAEIIIAKQRNGPTDTFKLTFLKPLTKFDNLAPGSAGSDY